MMAMGGPESGVRGSLQGRREPGPGLKLTAFECTFAVDDVERVAAAVRANGGRILMERTILAGVGELIFFQDPEGNVAGAMRYDEAAADSCTRRTLCPPPPSPLSPCSTPSPPPQRRARLRPP